MKNLLMFTLLIVLLSSGSCSEDTMESDTTKLAKIACESEKSSNEERKKELKDEFFKMAEEVHQKYKSRNEDTLLLENLYYTKVKDCLGYIPFR